jgi:hypothetical protein
MVGVVVDEEVEETAELKVVVVEVEKLDPVVLRPAVEVVGVEVFVVDMIGVVVDEKVELKGVVVEVEKLEPVELILVVDVVGVEIVVV